MEEGSGLRVKGKGPRRRETKVRSQVEGQGESVEGLRARVVWSMAAAQGGLSRAATFMPRASGNSIHPVVHGGISFDMSNLEKRGLFVQSNFCIKIKSVYLILR